MKRSLMFSLLFSALAFASQAMAIGYTSCSNGNFDELGDGYYQINFYEDGIEFSPYESSFSFDATEIEYQDGTYTIVNKTTTLSSEGEESKIIVDAILTLSEDRKTLNAAVSTNKSAFDSYAMTCIEIADPN